MLVVANVKLESVSPYSASRPLLTPRGSEESWDEYDTRVWREHLHINENNEVFIPPISLKQALESAASFLSMKVPEKGRQTFTKRFLQGILITDPILLGMRGDSEEISMLPVYCHADGKRGGKAPRVWRRYPVIARWSANASINIFDPDIVPKKKGALSDEILMAHLEAAGRFIGLGRFRPANGGSNGRFKVLGISFEVIKDKE